MSLQALQKTEFATRLGVVPLWHPAGALRSRRPALVTVTSVLADADAMSRLPAIVGDAADAFLMHLPGNHAPPLAEPGPAAAAAALSELIETAFSGRSVVVHGLSAGALVALGVRAASVRRIVAVEPPLSPAKLWPVLPVFQERLRAAPQDRDLHAQLDAFFGVGASDVRELRHHALLDGVAAPVDVVAGEDPLDPPRRLERAPSFVDEKDRAFLRGVPGVTLHVAPNAGNNVPVQAGGFLRDVLIRACRAAADAPTLSRAQEALLARTPIAAASLRYVGDRAGLFEAACRARNPALRTDPVGEAQALVADDLAALLATPAALDALAPSGVLVAALPPGPAEAAARLTTAVADRGLTVLQLQPWGAGEDHFDDRSANLWPVPPGGSPTDAAARGLVLVARRTPPPAPPLHLAVTEFAPRLMDIRTRLPAHALRTDPELTVAFQRAPARLPALPVDAPKVQVLQRPALRGADGWRQVVREAMRGGWVLVLEYDDHPDLVAEVTGRTPGPDDWLRFGYVHGVQTSTRPLAEAIGRYNGETRIFGNAVFELSPFPEAGPRRVFYGAVSRGTFAVEVARALAPATQAFPEVEFVVVGDRAVFDALPTANKRFFDFMPYEAYLRAMGECAVSLSPIEGRRHQETKSDAKFLDAASRGVLTIASPTIYAETIRHGETGLIAAEVADWGPLLAEVLGDEPKRRRMARAAWEYVRDERMFARQLPERRDWYLDLWRRRDELNRAVVARLPGLAEALAAP